MMIGGALDYKKEEPRLTEWGNTKEQFPRAMFVGYSRGLTRVALKGDKERMDERRFRMSKIVKREPSRSR